MQLGMVGLGRMGANMVRRLLKADHQCVVYNRSPQSVKELAQEGAAGTASPAELVKALTPPRAVWLMVPAAAVDSTIEGLVPHLAPGDILIDGGNSYYVDDIRRAKELAPKRIHYVDVGTIARTPGREAKAGTAEQGYLRCGGNGAGHFVKMVHNGIEYGLMAAYAEGLGILRAANVGKREHAVDAETTPLREPEHYQYDFDLSEITEVWRRGSVVASWLLDLTAAALLGDPSLSRFAGRVSDSGEGRWTIKAAIDESVPVPVLSTALHQRFSSRGEAEFQNKVLSAMRHAFGGHLEKSAGG